jgi:hypothetical protein
MFILPLLRVYQQEYELWKQKSRNYQTVLYTMYVATKWEGTDIYNKIHGKVNYIILVYATKEHVGAEEQLHSFFASGFDRGGRLASRLGPSNLGIHWKAVGAPQSRKNRMYSNFK